MQLHPWLMRGGDPNAKDAKNISLLEHAIKENKYKELRLLLHYGADPNTPLTFFGNVLHFSLDHQRPSHFLRLCLRYGADPNQADDEGCTPLIKAIENESQFSTIKLLLSHKANPLLADSQGSTPLHYATQKDCLKTVLLLIEAGASLTVRDIDGKTPLHFARENNQNTMIWEHLSTLIGISHPSDLSGSKEIAPRAICSTEV